MIILENRKLKEDKMYHVIVNKGRIEIQNQKLWRILTYFGGRFFLIYAVLVLYISVLK
jgi:hypothetical protein